MSRGQQERARAGLLYGFAAYGMWGLVPLFWPLLEPAGAVEILAHRMVWSLVGRRPRAAGAAPLGLDRRAAAAAAHGWALIAVAAAVISVNWGLYIWARQQRPRRRGLARLLHQPAGHHRHRASCCCGAAAARAVGGGRRRRGGRGRAGGRLRQPAVDLAHARLLLRHVRAGEEEGRPGRPGVAGRRDRRPVPARARLPAVARARAATARSRAEGAGHAALLAATGVVTALPLVCFGAAAIRRAAVHAGAAAVPGAGLPVPARRPVLPRGDAARAVGRLRPGVAGARRC